MWASSDEALLAGLGTGDPDASLAFVRRFQRRVYGLALLIVRDPGRAEDVAQEAFARAWRHAPAYDPRRGSVATWLLSITRNLAIDSLRVEKARPADLVEVPDLVLVDGGREPDEIAVRNDDVRQLAPLVRALPPEQRKAVLMAALYGFTSREISEMDGIPLGTAKTRIRTAMMRLREQLRLTERAE